MGDVSCDPLDPGSSQSLQSKPACAIRLPDAFLFKCSSVYETRVEWLLQCGDGPSAAVCLSRAAWTSGLGRAEADSPGQPWAAARAHGASVLAFCWRLCPVFLQAGPILSASPGAPVAVLAQSPQAICGTSRRAAVPPATVPHCPPRGEAASPAALPGPPHSVRALLLLPRPSQSPVLLGHVVLRLSYHELLILTLRLHALVPPAETVPPTTSPPTPAAPWCRPWPDSNEALTSSGEIRPTPQS